MQKLKVLNTLVFVMLLGGSFVFSQTNSDNKQPLITEFLRIDFAGIKLNKTETRGDHIIGIYDEPSTRGLELLNGLLSKRGSIEVGAKGKFLIITDAKDRIFLVERIIKLLDESGLSFKELFSRQTEATNFHSVEISFYNLDSTIGCGAGKEKIRWQIQQWKLVFPTIKKLLSNKGTLGLNGREKKFIISDNWYRTILFKQIIELFDEKILDDIPAKIN
jgi:hypothetical protein